MPKSSTASGRQRRAIAALRSTGAHIYQRDRASAAWYVWHPIWGGVRINLTCRDVMALVAAGVITRADGLGRRRLTSTEANRDA